MGKLVCGRMAALCDGGHFQEVFDHPQSFYISARGLVSGRPMMVIATDPEPGPVPADLDVSFHDMARALSVAADEVLPVVFLFDAPSLYQTRRTAFQGASAERLLGRTDGVGAFYYHLCRLALRVPVLGVVYGNMAQAQAFPVAMCHARAMLPGSSVSIARPDAVTAMLGQKTSYEAMGGVKVHARQSGLCDLAAKDQDQAMDWIRGLLDLLPRGSRETTPRTDPLPPDPAAAPLAQVIPEGLETPFQGRKVIQALADQGSFRELCRDHAKEVVVGPARIQGMACGLAVSNSMVNGGVLFPESCRKLSRFITLMSRFNLPLVFLADAPGFMIGEQVEGAGQVAAGAELFGAIAACTAPRLCVVLRRAYTAGLYAMGGSGFQPWRLLALPGASIGVYGPKAIQRFLENLDLPENRSREIAGRMAHEQSLQYLEQQGMIDGMVQPDELRAEIAGFLGQVQAIRRGTAIPGETA